MRRFRALVVGVALATAACGPPSPPQPVRGEPVYPAVAEIGILYNGRVICQALLGVEYIIDSPSSLTIASDVLVRGTGLPGVPCLYNLWQFTASVGCDDVSDTGCGYWRIETPDADLHTYQVAYRFARTPNDATLQLTFTGTYVGTTRTVTGRSDPIHCRNGECLFYG